MKNWMILPAVVLICFFASSSVLARGGGGCLAKGTPILTPAGAVSIEMLRPGDPVISVVGGKIQTGTVKAITQVRPAGYQEITAGEHKFLITAGHPVLVGPGEYRIAGRLQAGDHIYQIRNGTLQAISIHKIRPVKPVQPAYNLLVMPGGTFIPAGIVVHNKGCFLPDSEILKTDGTTIFIRSVRQGDKLLAYSPEGAMVHTRVKKVIRHRVDDYFLLKTAHVALGVTAEHPFYTGNGTFKTMEILRAGHAIFAWDGRTLSKQRIVSLEKVSRRVWVYNLQTDQPHTFFAAGLAVHNKGGGGCFPAGTGIRTLSGQIPIEKLSANDEIQAVDPNGKIVNARVEKIFSSRSFVLSVKTNRGELRTTAEHPIGLTDGTYLEAGLLQPGQKILFRDQGAFVACTVLETKQSAKKENVYNLSVNRPHTFLASDFVVHNKGGGGFSRSGSHSSGSRSGSSDDSLGPGFVFLMIAGILIIVAFKSKTESGREENLDYLYSRSQIDPKAAKTEKLLEFISRQDLTMSPQELRKVSETTFLKLQDCWQKRDYTPMKTLLMEDLFAVQNAQIQGLKRNHEINKLDDLQVKKVDIVNVRYTEKQDLREFTVLITASARDYYIDDRINAFLRGDRHPSQFQEFWTFQLSGKNWLLREIEQAGESDILKDENFVEMLTDRTIEGIYDETAGKEGTPGPWLAKPTEDKATRIERMLNFLVQTDKIWDRRLMLERSRKIFLNVYLARENGDPAKTPAADLFPAVAEDLSKTLQQWQMEGMNIEYRNLCVRKAELILIRNYADPAKDEFIVRISAHAQKIFCKGNRILSRQPYVTPFEEYWTFGRLDQVWKLKEVLPPSQGEQMISEENLDEESSPSQMQWYYRQTRAN